LSHFFLFEEKREKLLGPLPNPFLSRLMSIFWTLKCPIMYNLKQVNALKTDISEGIFEIKLICGCEFNKREIFRYPSPTSVWNFGSAGVRPESDSEVLQ
jgi:hypothetical protein